ncbi:glycosyltransferase family 1 protein [Peribacillus simplex]|uniref:glycosyltransferase family 1 protein n=1 Tax=Peribacillus simplex TaxID=1478 RepID=UPI000F6304CD|nr:glycosyltransferase family 1 protein [Peribacillus simplex]RRN69918.1 glycosyltransferase family 1 protein [Peribacillus simplex]
MANIMRILHVLGGMGRGGAETMVMNLYRNIDRTKIQFDFIVHTEKKCDYDDEIKSLGGKIHRVPRYTGKNHFQYRKAWHNFFIKHPEYKLIHGHVRSTASIYIKVAKKYGLNTIAHSHNTSSGNGFSAVAKNILQYPIRYNADYLFSCSEFAGEWLFGKRACKKDNYFILNNAIDIKKFSYDKDIRLKKKKEFQLQNKFVIGHVGRFHTQKNHEFLIDIFKAVYVKNDNAVLMLVGDGELRHSIEKKVNDLGLNDSVVFTGVRSDIPDLLQLMDVFVFPSLHEGLPVTLVEAQAAGLPCLISDCITNEVRVTDLVTYLPIDLDERWAEEIVRYSENVQRKDTYQEVDKAQYNIETTSKWLQEFYFKANKV